MQLPVKPGTLPVTIQSQVVVAHQNWMGTLASPDASSSVARVTSASARFKTSSCSASGICGPRKVK